MENYTQTCRFILSANYSSKIIDPIQSRCAIFRFRPLEKEDLFSVIDRIVKEEGLTLGGSAKDALFEISYGDCRKAENILQACGSFSKKIDDELVFSMAAFAKPKDIKEIMTLAIKNRFVEARNLLLGVMLKYGLSGDDMIKQIQKEIMELDIDGRKKMELISECGEAEFRMSEGSDEFIQLEAFLSRVVLAGYKQ